MAVSDYLIPPTVLRDGTATPIPGAVGTINTTVYADQSRNALLDPTQPADRTGTFSPASAPLYAAPGAYTIAYVDPAGVARTAAVTVTGPAVPSSSAPITPSDPAGGDAALAASLSGTYQLLGATVPTCVLPSRAAKTFIVDFGVAGHGFATGTASLTTNANDTTTYVRGTQSFGTTTKGTGLVTGFSKTTFGAMNLVGKKFEVSLMVDDWTHARAILIYLGDTGFTNFSIYTLWDVSKNSGIKPAANGEWFTLTFDPSVLSSSTGAGANLAGVTTVQVAMQDDNTGNSLSFHCNSLSTFPGQVTYPNGVVTFSFDDSYASQYAIARPKLDQYNYQGTFYTICDALGSSNYYMTLAQLKQMQDVMGHEISPHAYTLANHNIAGGYTALSAAALDAELRALKQWFVANGFRGRDHFAYPQGLFNPATETALRNYFGSARLTLNLPMETHKPANCMRLRAGLGLNTPQTLAAAKSQVDLAFTNGSWLHIVTHDIVAAPPTPAGTTLIQWDTSSFNQLVDYVATKNMPVRTVGDVLQTAT